MDKFKVLTVFVDDVQPPWAWVRDSFGRKLKVRTDIRRGGGRAPKAGETWFIDRYLGNEWTFVALYAPEDDGGAAGFLPRDGSLPMVGNLLLPNNIKVVLGDDRAEIIHTTDFTDRLLISTLDQFWLQTVGGFNFLVGPVNEPAYLLGDIIYFTSDDTFDHGDYPGLRAIDVEVQAAGGGAGSAPATTGSNISAASGGSSGGYGRSRVLVSDLDTSEAVTVGAGGPGGTSGGNGSSGEASIFNTLLGNISAPGGLGGQPMISGTTDSVLLGSGPSGTAIAAQFQVPGRQSPAVVRNAGGSRIAGMQGADSFLGVGGAASITTANPGFQGGGGGGARNSGESAAKTGGPGGDGIVIVRLLY
jgi:hypothetical protein